MSRVSAVVLGLLLAQCRCAFSLDPSLELTQYAHTTWTARDGLKGVTRAIAQTPDGYIWVGTEFGLSRFDGARFVPWVPPTGQALPSSNIRSLLAARDGTLWIGTVEGLASWNKSKLIGYPETAGQNVLALYEDHEDTIWVGTFGTPYGKLCAIRTGSTQCYGNEGSFGQWVYTIIEDDGQLWVHTGHGLWRWQPGPPKQYHVKLPGSFESSQTLVTGGHGAGLAVITDGAVRRFVDETLSDYPLPPHGPFTPLNLLRDRNGGLWIGTEDRGVVRIYEEKSSSFAQSDGLSSNRVLSLFEDREGNVWVGTTDGLDRFREFAVPSLSAKQGLSAATIMAVLAGRDGSIWISSLGGLERWKNGHVSIYRARSSMSHARPIQPGVTEVFVSEFPDDQPGSLFEDERGRIWISTAAGILRFESGRFSRLAGVPGGWVNSIVGDGVGGLWISYQDYGLFHFVNQKIVEQIPWSKFHRAVVASALLPDSIHGGLWIGFFQGGLAYWKDSSVRASYGKEEGLGTGRVMDLRLHEDGIWAATEGGLSRVRNGRVTTLTTKNGLPCNTIHWAVRDQGSVWLYTACGLLRISTAELDAWGSSPLRRIHFSLFDNSDGVRTHALLTGCTPRVSKSASGQVWFANIEGVSVVDPSRIDSKKTLPPPVHIEQIVADHKVYWQNLNGLGSPKLDLPPRTRDLTVDYSAPSFVAPQNIHFKYKLDGQDQDWREVVNDREVQYSNLPPGPYRFQVTASNERGVWNQAGDTLAFSIHPAYYQTTWFRALSLGALATLLWLAYQLRLQQFQRKFNLAAEARVGERSRIARDLHDSLLQTVQGFMLRLQAVIETVPPGSIRDELESALEIGDRAIVEGREAVQDLRCPHMDIDLIGAIRNLGDELGGNGTAAFRLVVEGRIQEVHPLIRDEIFAISREALRNAFKHARARHIEVEIMFTENLMDLKIRDDGKGITHDVAARGLPGHYGLPGMHERARQIGSKLTVRSSVEAGTEIGLSVPGSLAYARSSVRPLSRLIRWAERGRL